MGRFVKIERQLETIEIGMYWEEEEGENGLDTENLESSTKENR